MYFTLLINVCPTRRRFLANNLVRDALQYHPSVINRPEKMFLREQKSNFADQRPAQVAQSARKGFAHTLNTHSINRTLAETAA
ncbi:MAG TPA: hypothetical protein VGM65_11975 [Candidatus Udaeobacter sp.]|jgi:hypothetical protein